MDKNETPQVKTLCKIRDIYRSINLFEVEFHEKYGISLNEGMLLCSLDSKENTSSELAEILGLSFSNTSKIIKSLENKLLIRRMIGVEDKRQMYFTLNESGMELLASIKNASLEIPQDLKIVLDQTHL